MRSNRFLSCALLAFVLGVGPGGARAHSTIPEQNGATTRHLVEEANLIVVARVIGVEYRLSEPDDKTRLQVPHTLVTYRLLQNPLRGTFSTRLNLVLRFPGGSDGRGHFLEVEGVPLSQQGDTVVLFIRSNGEKGENPLVEGEWGRFRLLENVELKTFLVHDTFGKPVFAINRNRINSSGPAAKAFMSFSFPTPLFDELIKNPEVEKLVRESGKPLDELKKQYEAEAPAVLTLADVPGGVLPRRVDSTDDKDAIRSTGGNQVRKPLALDSFSRVVVTLNEELLKQGRLPGRITSVDPKAPILFDSSVVARPPAPIDEEKPTATTAKQSTATLTKRMTAQEQSEAAAYEANHFNPVLD